MDKKVVLEEEKKKLASTVEKIQQLLDGEQDNLDNLYGNDFLTMDEFRIKEVEKKLLVRNLKIAVKNPYFARIDFTYDDDKTYNKIYIGKKGILDNGKTIVTDWRAPIASLYYDADVGRCSFKAPGGNISGDLSLKRQFEIENGELLNYFDVNLVSNDELLQKYLNTNNDARLKSIVATIQKEQNEVIRRERRDNLIIQGVAGSGKTTVALHRIAYLVYNNKQNVKQNQYLVIGPNPVFMKYIESVLPDLDVVGVEQFTYEQFAGKYIGEDIKVNSSEKRLAKNIAGKIDTNIYKFKCSMEYKNLIDIFMEVYYKNITSKPLLLGDFEVLSSKEMTHFFQDAMNHYNYDLKTVIDMASVRISQYINDISDRILTKYSIHTKEIFANAKTDADKNALRKRFAAEREEMNADCRNIVKKYLSKGVTNVTKLYKLFVSSVDELGYTGFNELKELKTDTLKTIREGSYDFEDLAAMIYIKSIISPSNEYDRIKHIVIDEAQDFGLFNFYTLKNALPSATFSIFGDLAQSIYDYRSINCWEDVNKIMFNNTGDIINFNKSYRTTAEIMNVADDVAESIGLGRSDLVVRHGEQVDFTSIDNPDDIPKHIVEKIKEYVDKGYKTIALISKTNLLSNYLSDDLSFLNTYVSNVTIDDDLTDDKFNTCCISNYLAKGLEFDAVIINNANEQIYSSENSLDMKLLYIAITRALHELDVVYSGELTKPLQRSLNRCLGEEESKVKKLTDGRLK